MGLRKLLNKYLFYVLEDFFFLKYVINVEDIKDFVFCCLGCVIKKFSYFGDIE